MADLYLTPAERYTAALGGFYYGDLPEPGTVYTQLIKDILDGATPDKEPKNILARFIYSLYISDLGDPYPRYELAKLLYWKLHDITPTKSGSILTVTIDGKVDYMTINTDLSRLWYKVLFGSKTGVITDFPYIFNTMQNKLSDWELFGNVEISGTPTPDNPVITEGTGERTANLWDEDYANISSNAIYRPLFVGDGVFTLSTNFEINNGITDIFLLSGNVSSGISSSTNGAYEGKNITAQSVDGYITIAYRANARPSSGSLPYCKTMLNSGSIPLPYEPYGIKIPISCGGTTTPVYLGEVQTTREIGKIDLGTLNWSKTQSGNFWANTAIEDMKVITNIQQNNALCDMFNEVLPDRVVSTPYSFSSCLNGQKRPFVNSTGFESMTAAEFKEAMSGVYMYYVLETPETAVVNEPLMKIDEYADSLSRAQTGIDIPTVVGQNTLDVLTTVKPSSMRIEYTSADETRSRSKRISLLKSPLKKGLIK